MIDELETGQRGRKKKDRTDADPKTAKKKMQKAAEGELDIDSVWR